MANPVVYYSGQDITCYPGSNQIDDGKLKVLNSDIEFSNMSKSEQNFFKFLYFDILVYQKQKSGKLHIIVDDPFDSYDDIYVQDSIGIIVNLINESIPVFFFFTSFICIHSTIAIIKITIIIKIRL